MYGEKKRPLNASNFSPKFATGARLPHAWIKRRANTVALDVVPVDLSYVQEFGQDDVDARQFSTLDLVSFDAFTLIVSCHEAWAARFEKLYNLTQPTGITLQFWSMDQDFDFVYEQQRKMFNSGAAFDRGGGVLVRPDQHLLGCVDENATAEDLESLIRKHLGK